MDNDNRDDVKSTKIMKSKRYFRDLHDRTDEELSTELVNKKRELFNLRFRNATNQLDNTASITQVRKDIARIHTLITKRNSEPRRKTSKSQRREAAAKAERIAQRNLKAERRKASAAK